MATGYLHIDGNAALGREPARPHHWLMGLAAVIVAQWIMWNGSSLGEYAGYFWVSETGILGFEPSSALVVPYLFNLLVPTAAFGALALYISRRFDRRDARSIGLDGMTLPLTLAWMAAGLIAAAPHAVAVMVRGGLGEGWLLGSAILTAVTVVQAGAEEILFRGIILGFLCARYGARVGVLISALLFAFWHLYLGQPPADAIVLLVSTFVFGLTSAVLTLHYANLGPALGLHIIWNVAGYLSAAAGGGPFLEALASTFIVSWTWGDFANGNLIRMLIIPLAIESLIIFAACRETARKLIGSPHEPEIA